MRPARQNGCVVKDIETSMQRWIDVLGIGPSYYLEKVPVDYFRHRGAEQDINLSIAMANKNMTNFTLYQGTSR
jgi:hypothetical protein